MCGRKWTRVIIVGRAEDSVLYFIYTPAVTVGLQVRRINLSCSLSLSSLPPLLFQCRILSYFENIRHEITEATPSPPPDQSRLNKRQAHPPSIRSSTRPTSHASSDSTISQGSSPLRGCITTFCHILHQVKRRLFSSP